MELIAKLIKAIVRGVIVSARPKMLQLCAVGFTVEKLLIPLVNEMSKNYDVTVAMSYDSTTDVLKCNGYNIKNISIDRKISPVKNLKSLINIYKLIKKEEFDIVHVHTPIAGLLGRIAARIAGTPVIIYTAHGFYFHDKMQPIKRKLFIWFEKVGAWFCDYIFTQSDEDRKTAIFEGIISSDKIMTIGNGIDISRFNPSCIDNDKIEVLRDELKIDKNEVVIGITGRVVREKGYVELVKAAAEVVKESPNTKFIAIGDTLESDRDGIKNWLDAFISDNKLNDKFIFAGSRSDVPELLSLIDIFTLPSYREGMPRSIIEAMSMGKPVVATNIRGCREEVIEGETGYLVNVGDAKDLAQKLSVLIKDKELREKMGKSARARALKEYDETIVLERQKNKIDELLRGVK